MYSASRSLYISCATEPAGTLLSASMRECRPVRMCVDSLHLDRGPTVLRGVAPQGQPTAEAAIGGRNDDDRRKIVLVEAVRSTARRVQARRDLAAKLIERDMLQ